MENNENLSLLQEGFAGSLDHAPHILQRQVPLRALAKAALHTLCALSKWGQRDGKFKNGVVKTLKAGHNRIWSVAFLGAFVLSGCVPNVCGNTGQLDADAQQYCDYQTKQANFEKGQRIGASIRGAVDSFATGTMAFFGLDEASLGPPIYMGPVYLPTVSGVSPEESVVEPPPAYAPFGNRLDPAFVPPPPVHMLGFSQSLPQGH